MAFISAPFRTISLPSSEGGRGGRTTINDHFLINEVGSMAVSYQNALMIHNPLRGIHQGRQVGNLVIPVNVEHRQPLIVANISVVAILPLFIIVCTVVLALLIVKIRQWRKQKLQLECLARIYDALEDVIGAHIEANPIGNITRSQYFNDARMCHAVALCRDDKTPFFQPASRMQSLKFDRLLRPKTAYDVISHFTQKDHQQSECN